MNDENEVIPTPEEGTVEATEVQVEESATEVSKELKSALIQKEHFRSKFEKAEADRVALEAKLNESAGNASKTALDVEEVLNITTSLEGLDQREKEYVVKQHKLTGKSIQDIRKDEDFTLWQGAYRTKIEKEQLALKPSGTQPNSDRPRTLTEKLANATLAEKEKILAEAGLYKQTRPNLNRVDIGAKR